MKRLVTLVVLLAAIVPPPAGAFDLVDFVNKAIPMVEAAGKIRDAVRSPSASELTKLANQLDEGLITQYGVTDEGLARVQRIVQRLAPDKGYQVQILATDAKNAMAIPGHIYVTVGLVRATTDDELAGVLAHEIEHNEKGHFKDAVKRQRIASGVGGALQLAGANETIQTAVSIPTVLAVLKYTRDQEYVADDAGQKRAAGAGFDPRGLPDALRKLEGKGRSLEIASTHPETQKRVARLDKAADEWGKVGTVQGPASQNQRGQSPLGTVPIPAPTPTFLGGIAVIVRDNASGGYFGWGGYSNSEEAVKTTMESALEKTGRFTVVDQSGREEAWQEQDLGETGRMDPTTVPARGKTHGAKWFLYITLNYYQVTDEGQVAIGNWNSRANIALVKAEIRGKVKLEPVERSTLAWTADFRGMEIGKNIEASVSNWQNGIDVAWRSQPAGKAVESACQKAAAGLVAYIDSQKGQTAQASTLPAIEPSKPDTDKVEAFRLYVQSADGGEKVVTINAPGAAVRAADYILFMNGEDTVAKVVINYLKDREIWGALAFPDDLGIFDQHITRVRLMKSDTIRSTTPSRPR